MISLELHFSTEIQVTERLLSVVVDSSPELRHLTLPSTYEDETSLELLGPLLQRLTRLQTLSFTHTLDEISMIVTALSRSQPETAERMLERMKTFLPSSLRDLRGVSFEFRYHDGFVTFPGYLFAFLCRQKVGSDFALRLLKEIGVDSVPRDAEHTILLQLLKDNRIAEAETLLREGADLYRAVSVRYPSTSKFTCQGNFMHQVGLFHLGADTSWFATVSGRRPLVGADAKLLRTSTGFTPLHFPRDFVSWRILFTELVQWFPDILHDRDNILCQTPVEAIHAVHAGGSPYGIYEIYNFIEMECPNAVEAALPGLLGRVLAYYGSRRDNAAEKQPISTFVPSVISRLLNRLLKSLDLPPHTPGAPLPLSRETLGLKSSDASLTPLEAAYPIAGALLYAPDLFPILVQDQSVTVLSAALALIARHHPHEHFAKHVKALLAHGADLNHTHPEVFQGVSFLPLLLIAGDDEDDHAAVWTWFYRYYDQGADIMQCGKPISVFDLGPWSQDMDGVYRGPVLYMWGGLQSPLLLRFLRWLGNRRSFREPVERIVEANIVFRRSSRPRSTDVRQLIRDLESGPTIVQGGTLIAAFRAWLAAIEKAEQEEFEDQFVSEEEEEYEEEAEDFDLSDLNSF